jgi:hypothetical protein
MYYDKAAVTAETYFEPCSAGQLCATQVEWQMLFTTGNRQVRLYTVCDSGWNITRSFFRKYLFEVFPMQPGKEF